MAVHKAVLNKLGRSSLVPAQLLTAALSDLFGACWFVYSSHDRRNWSSTTSAAAGRAISYHSLQHLPTLRVTDAAGVVLCARLARPTEQPSITFREHAAPSAPMPSSLGAQHAADGLLLSCFVASILWSTSLTLGALITLARYGTGITGAWLVLALQAVLALLPLGEQTPRLAQRFVRHCCVISKRYLSVRVVVEDEASLRREQAYILALEPHSALPTAIPAVFSVESPLAPPALQGRCHGMVADVCFSLPWVRQLYWWWGFRPVTKPSICALLARGRCPVIIPGGVQECLYMQHDHELAYLRRRHGFIRLAIQQGVPVVPVFAFGQSQVYNWWRLGPPFISQSTLNALARKLGCAPLLLYGRWGSIIPNSVPMTVVIGKPLVMPHTEAPTHELVQEHLDRYIEALTSLFERNKADCGHPKLQLKIM